MVRLSPTYELGLAKFVKLSLLNYVIGTRHIVAPLSSLLYLNLTYYLGQARAAHVTYPRLMWVGLVWTSTIQHSLIFSPFVGLSLLIN